MITTAPVRPPASDFPATVVGESSDPLCPPSPLMRATLRATLRAIVCTDPDPVRASLIRQAASQFHDFLAIVQQKSKDCKAQVG